jgi:predicted ATPase
LIHSARLRPIKRIDADYMLVRLSCCELSIEFRYNAVVVSKGKGKMHTVEDSDRFFIVTGGPGSGKSALIDALEQRGYACSVEAGRGIIQDQMAIGGEALPWSDRMLFAELMLSWEMRSYRMVQNSPGSVFFDRGVIDVLGYLRLVGLPIPEHMHKAAGTFRYHRRALIAPPWQEIFHQDRERKQDFEEAVRTYDAMVTTYDAYGYELIELPRASLEDRVRFVLHEIVGPCR